MKSLRLFAVLFAVAVLVLPLGGSSAQTQSITDAPTGFDDLTNGFLTQEEFDAAREVFDEDEFIEDGLGPVYNAQSCGECHQNPTSGGISQITELRAGHFNGVVFVDQAGGSLNNDRATNADIQERIPGGNEVRTFRTSLNTLGDGFVEAIDSNTLAAIAAAQPSSLRGTLIQVPVTEAGGALRVGRFGWKNQHASLVSFSGDAYLNEMGITNCTGEDCETNGSENTSNGQFVGFGSGFDPVPDPEDDGEDVEIFANFMRSTKAPARDAALVNTPDVVNGSALFNAIGCNICHTRSIVTSAPGTVINGGEFTVPAALGNKRIQPLSDFLLHNVGTGDGIVQNGGQGTRNQVRTPPLWGMRTRDRLMHDGDTLNRNESILRHAGQATAVINNYRALSDTNKARLIAFLDSL